MLITFEGIDGSGKTTATSIVQAEFPGVTVTHEPTDSWYGQAVHRSISDDEADPLAELFLYTADHAHHLDAVIKPALVRGEVVVSDRYIDSRYAYQGASLTGILPNPMGFVQAIHDPWTRVPDSTIYFDIDPAAAVERTGQANKFERIEFLTRVRENYERLIDGDPDRFVRIDASQARDAVAEAVLVAFDSLLRSSSA